MTKLAKTLCICILMLPVFALARVKAIGDPLDILFGPEFTFSGPDGLITKDHENGYLRALHQHLIVNQPYGAKFTREGHRFISPNGWNFNVETNPGVLEITMEPMTAADFRKYASDIQDAIFVTAANQGLFPFLFLGGGHINISTHMFGRNVRWARNFVMDYWNHNELAMGILGYDTNNALPFQLLEPEIKAEALELIDLADRGHYRMRKEPVDDFFYDLNEVLIRSRDEALFGWAGEGESPTPRGKHHALNFSNTNDNNSIYFRLEVRSVRPQASAYAWAQQIDMFDRRLRYLRKLREPIPYQLATPLKTPVRMTFKRKGHILNPPVNVQKALASFDRYLTEIGLEIVDFEDMIWPAWKTYEWPRYLRKKYPEGTSDVSCAAALGSD